MATDNPPASPPTTSGTSTVRSSTSSYMGALRIPIAILLLVVGVYAAYYFLYVTGERDYLIGRNFRLLATMGEQLDATIQSDQSVLKNLLKVEPGKNQSLRDVFKAPLTAEFIPILKTATPLFADPNPTEKTFRTTFAERDSRITWSQKGETVVPPGTGATVRLELDDLLTPVLAGELQTGIFSTVAMAAHDGRVIFQAGNPRLRIDRLDNIEVDAKTPTPLDFAKLARSSAMVDVRIAGSGYTLLMQPCCARMIRADGSAEGWVLVGLMEQQAMAAASAAVPFSIMALLMALLLLAVLSWPFLKLSFIGEAQRVTAHDVVLIGLGALLGIALVTVMALDLYTYSRLEAVLDDQLQHFAASVSRQANEEVAAAYDEMTQLESEVLPVFDHPGPVVEKELAQHFDTEQSPLKRYPFFESLAVLNERGDQRKKLVFESFVTPLINAGNRDYFRYWSHERATPAFLQPLVSATTGTRQAVLSKRVDDRTKAADRSEPANPLAVTTLTIPMHALIDPVMVPGFGFAVINGDGRVLFHSDPRHNLSEDFFVESDGSRRLKALVSARHQEWADIKYWGDDRRVFVTPLELSIGADQGRPIALFGEPWTLITFYDKDLVRTVNVEWLVIVVVLLSLYAGGYVAVCVGVLLLRPTYRAPWLWPDPARSRAYLDAVPPLLVLAVTFAVLIVVFAPGDIVMAAGLLPLMAWIVAYHALSPRVSGAGSTWMRAIGVGVAAVAVAGVVWWKMAGWRGLVVAWIGCAVAWALAGGRFRRRAGRSPMALPVSVSYGLATGLFLLLIAAMPAAASFKIAYDTVIESFIKYGQLQIALDRGDQQDRANDIIAKRITDPPTATQVASLRAAFPKWWGGYDTFFFCTRIGGYQDEYPEDKAACPPLDTARSGSLWRDDAATIPELVEESLPFYSESSVWFRELVHDRAADNSWRWDRSGSTIALHFGATQPLEFASIKPPFVGLPGGDPSFAWRVLSLALVAVAVLGAVCWVARFILRSVFVVDLIEPLWSQRRADCVRAAEQPVVPGAMLNAAPAHALDPIDAHVSPEWRELLAPAGATATKAIAAHAATDAHVMAVLTGGGAADWRELAWRLNALGFSHSVNFLEAECRDPVVGRLWSDVLPYAWHPDRPALDVGQLIAEVGERAEPHYCEIWSSCTPAEKLVLGQVAAEGLVNEKTKRTVRVLMARGLVRRQPHFTLMNETFRQFVLSPERRHEVAALEEQSRGAWDVMRGPFLIILLASLGFFFATQQELFKTVLGAMTAAATLLPFVVKAATSFGERKSAA